MVKFKVLLFFILLYTLSFGQDIKVRASVDSVDYEVGDYINYKITVTHSKDINVTRPAIQDSLGTLELIRINPMQSEEKDGRTKKVFEYVLSKYDSGDVIIPSIPVIYNQRNQKDAQVIRTNAVSLTVHTLKIDPHGDVKDIKEPIKIPLDWKTLLIWILVGLVILGLIIWRIQYYRKKKALREGAVVTIRREPHEEAFNSLKELEAKKLWQKGFIKQYHTEITAVIRKYFEERFSIPALELTTSELMQKLDQSRETSEISQITNDFLNNADMVKFAKYVPMNDINEEMMKQAFTIVEKTVPVIVEEKQDNV